MTSASSSSAWNALLMLLLALQFGLQPILYKEFAATAVHSSVLVIGCEVWKFVISLGVLLYSGALMSVVKTWEFGQSIRASGLPACTYALQNVLIQTAMQNLPPIVFNLINQTKLLWTALFIYVLIGSKFSIQQCVAMLLLLTAAVLLSVGQDDSTKADNNVPMSFELGIVPVVLASMLSGFGGAMTQRSMQLHQRNPALVTIELSFYGSLFLVLSLFWSSSSTSSSSLISTPISLKSLLDGCDHYTLIPVVTSALGGLLVGAVTKSLGGVMKSFALICGIAFTALIESFFYGSVLPKEVWIAAMLVAVSMVLYSSNPYQKKATTAKAKND